MALSLSVSHLASLFGFVCGLVCFELFAELLEAFELQESLLSVAV